jgi:hypothetical protein
MGRPAKPIDAEMVRKLARLGCTQEDIAEFFDCAQSVISERFRLDFQLGRVESRISLRRLQWKAARAGSSSMLIHLGKVYLGQISRLDVTSGGEPVRTGAGGDLELSDEQLDNWAEARLRCKGWKPPEAPPRYDPLEGGSP